MDIISSISAGLESIKIASEGLKYFKNYSKTIENVEFNSKIIELNETILIIKEKLLEAKEGNLELQEKITFLENQLKDKSEMVFEENVYYRINGDKKEGPFCPTCYDSKGKKIRLHHDDKEWFCKNCSLYFNK